MRAHHACACGLACGYAADLLLADPERGHPVAAFGRAATAAERALWRDDRAAGLLYAALCAGGAAGGAAALTRAVRALPGRVAASVAPAALVAAGTWAALGGASLAREAHAIADALEADDLERARELLPRLCGRDPWGLDADALARAVVESVAENTSDAVVGALVWGALAGLPGLAGFRAVNTLDAMVGHRSPRYRRFGWAAARLDDAAGWPGARLTASLAVLAGGAPARAARAWRADGRRHPSPNAGPVEAAFAGALGVRLGGTLSYAGRVERRPVLNGGGRAVTVRDIARAVRLSQRVGALALALAVAARLGAGARAVGRTPVAGARAVGTRVPATPGRVPATPTRGTGLPHAARASHRARPRRARAHHGGVGR